MKEGEEEEEERGGEGRERRGGILTYTYPPAGR